MRNLSRIIGGFYYDESIDLERRLLRLVGLYTISAIILAVPCFYIAGYDMSIYLVCGASILLLATSFGIFFYLRDVRLTSITFCYSVNLVVLPLFFIYGGGIYGGMEFLFLCGLIDGMFLLKRNMRLLSEVIFLSWYILVIVYLNYHHELLHNIPTGLTAVFSMAMCVLFSTLIFLVIMDYERSLLNTKRKNVEEAVWQSTASAETKSRFLSNVSHELRTPMNAVIGMSGIIQNADHGGELTEEISIITHNARDLLSTINSILDYSRLESEKLALSYDQFEFDTMMREIVEEASIRSEEKGIDPFIDIDPDSPNVLYGDHIQIGMILQDLLHDAIDSVADGRVSFSIRGIFSEDMSRAAFIAEISDTGEGISEEDLETIYSSFETYDSRQDSRIKRLGLKYSVFRGILRLMNGDFRIRSLQGVGTTITVSFEVFTVERMVMADKTFTLGRKVLLYAYGEKGLSHMERDFASFNVILDVAYMPDSFAKLYRPGEYRYLFISDQGYDDVAHLVNAEDRDKIYVITDRMGTPADFDGLRIVRRPISAINLSDIFFERWEDIETMNKAPGEGFIAPDAGVLVVDDNMVNLKVAESLLAKYKVRIRLAESGFAAIDILKREGFDLVLLDQVMPGMDGFEAMRLIRSSLVIRGARRIPIVCMTADAGGEIREKVMRAGFNEYLSKPVNESDLEKLLLAFIPEEKIIMTKAAG